jgi:hypothetical protein
VQDFLGPDKARIVIRRAIDQYREKLLPTLEDVGR